MAFLNLDKILGTTINPASPYLSPEQQKSFESQQLFDTLLGAGAGYQSQLYQNKGFFDKALGLLQGARQGRQSTIDLYTKAIQSQFGMQKDLEDLKKTSMENQFLRLKQAGVEDAIRNTNDPELINSYFIDPVGTAQQLTKVNYPAPSFSESLGVKAIGGDAKNLTPEQALLLKQSESGLSQKDILDARLKQAETPALKEVMRNVAMPTAADILYKGISNQNIPTGQNVSYTPPTQIRIPSPSLTDRNEPIAYQNKGGFTVSPQAGVRQPSVKPAPYSTAAATQPVQVSTQKQPTQIDVGDATNELQYLNNEFANSTGFVGQNVEYSPKTVQKFRDEYPTIISQSSNMLSEYNNALLQIDRLLNHEGFDDIFSTAGIVAANLSPKGKEAYGLWQNIKDGGVLKSLMQMKLDSPTGATPYGQMNYAELTLSKNAFTEVADTGRTPASAREGIMNLRDKLGKAYDNMIYKHGVIYGNQGMDRFEKQLVTNFDTNAGKAILGSVLKGKAFGKDDRMIQSNYYYVQLPDGSYDTITNPKTKKPLTKQDMLKQGFNNIFLK